MIPIRCPHCGIDYEVSDTDVGLEANCESCGQSFVISKNTGKPERRKRGEPYTPPPIEERTTEPPASKPAKTIKKPIHCPVCDSMNIKQGSRFNICVACGCEFDKQGEHLENGKPSMKSLTNVRVVYNDDKQKTVKVTDIDISLEQMITLTFRFMLAMIMVNLVLFGLAFLVLTMFGISISSF